MASKHTILINNDALIPIKKVKTLEQAEAWAQALLPANDFYIMDAKDKKHLSVYTAYELAHIYFHLTNELPTVSTNYSKLLTGVQELMINMPVDKTPLSTLQAMIKKPVKERKAGGVATKKPSKMPETTKDIKDQESAKPEQKVLKRPREGTKTAQAWDIYDQLRETHRGEPDRALFVAEAVDNGINKATASTQFAKWKAWLAEN